MEHGGRRQLGSTEHQYKMWQQFEWARKQLDIGKPVLPLFIFVSSETERIRHCSLEDPTDQLNKG